VSAKSRLAANSVEGCQTDTLLAAVASWSYWGKLLHRGDTAGTAELTVSEAARVFGIAVKKRSLATPKSSIRPDRHPRLSSMLELNKAALRNKAAQNLTRTVAVILSGRCAPALRFCLFLDHLCDFFGLARHRQFTNPFGKWLGPDSAAPPASF